MATILNFRATESSSRDEDCNAEREACEIILFPGVRYERWDDETPPAPERSAVRKKSRGNKKRDRLVIPD